MARNSAKSSKSSSSTQNVEATKAPVAPPPAPVAAAKPAPAPVAQNTAKSPVQETTTVSARPTAPTYEQVARRAYELFLARGRQHGFHELDWAQAERELRLGRQ